MTLKKGPWLLIVNLLALPGALLFGAFFYVLAILVRGDLNLVAASAAVVPPTLLSAALSIVLHELIHGLGFWWFTCTTPKFGCTLWGAYAAAPDWYLPRNQHLIVGLLPFGVITSLGVLLLFTVPAPWVAAIVFLLVLNAIGAMGDLLIAFFGILEAPSTLVQDMGMKILFYRPG